MRLFNKANKISAKTKRSRLKREYKKLSELNQRIFFMDLGREGANERAKVARQRNVAVQMAEAEGISVDKAIKIVKKSVEAQEKADAARVAAARNAASKSSPKRRKARKSTPPKNRSHNYSQRVRHPGSGRYYQERRHSSSAPPPSRSRRPDRRR